MDITETALPGVLLFETRIYRDARGHFLETWQAERYREAGVDGPFVQDNLSFSRHGVLRGMHFQNPHPQGKLVTVLHGEVFDVVVDVRPDSPHFRHWIGYTLSGENGRQLWIPPGYAHGFLVTGESALFSYKCTAYYAPAAEQSIRWDDPDIGIEWPVRAPVLSEKDAAALLLREIPADRLPGFRE